MIIQFYFIINYYVMWILLLIITFYYILWIQSFILFYFMNIIMFLSHTYVEAVDKILDYL